MQDYLIKSAAILMAIVMVLTAVVCRCGMASCITPGHARAVDRPEPQQECERGCGKHDRAPQQEHSPNKCNDCEKDKVVFDRPDPGTDAVVQVQLFSPIVIPVWSEARAILLAAADRCQATTGPPIDVLRQSCLLLI